MEGYQVHMTLDELHIGRKGRITAVGGEGILRCRLLDMGLIPQTIVSVTKVAPMGDPMELLLPQPLRERRPSVPESDSGQQRGKK